MECREIAEGLPSSQTPPTRFRWCFEAISQGLRTWGWPNPPEGGPLGVSKPVGNSALFDANGAPLTAAEAANVSTWRSHHAFGARCGQTPQQQQSFDDWSIQFRVMAESDDAHVLLSVGPRYFPYAGASSFLPRGPPLGSTSTDASGAHELAPCTEEAKGGLCPLLVAHSEEEQRVFDKRMLETPLIYEEPYTISVECTHRGMFLWSDQWQLCRQQIAETCVSARALSKPEEHAANPTVSEAFVKLSWRLPREPVEVDHKAVLAIFLGESLDASSGSATVEPTLTEDKEKRVQWSKVYETSLELEDSLARTAAFVPYVTLMEAGEGAYIIQ